MDSENAAPDLPPYSLDVQAMDLGPGVKAVGLELIETESREPLRGEEAAAIWSGALEALAGTEPYVVDFFSHLDRVGPAAANGDAALENELSHRGLDAYQQAYSRYTCCAICEPGDGWVTLLSETLWPSEIIRRVRPALQAYDVYIARPQ